MKVGFIGLGTMGGHMAYNALNGGNELVVHDINQAAAARHLELSLCSHMLYGVDI